MYFKDRTDAGYRLAERLKVYSGQKCTLVALSDGAVVVASPVAMALQCPITMLLAEQIHAPGEPDAIGSISQSGIYSQSSAYSRGQHDEFEMEYHHAFEQQKLDKLHKMHRLLGKNELIRKDLLRGHSVILIADGLGSSATIDAALLFLKSIKIKRLIIATPFASLNVVDRMHILADDIVCLNVLDNFMGIDHYYEQNNLPTHQDVIRIIQEMVNSWGV